MQHELTNQRLQLLSELVLLKTLARQAGVNYNTLKSWMRYNRDMERAASDKLAEGAFKIIEQIARLVWGDSVQIQIRREKTVIKQSA